MLTMIKGNKWYTTDHIREDLIPELLVTFIANALHFVEYTVLKDFVSTTATGNMTILSHIHCQWYHLFMFATALINGWHLLKFCKNQPTNSMNSFLSLGLSHRSVICRFIDAVSILVTSWGKSLRQVSEYFAKQSFPSCITLLIMT